MAAVGADEFVDAQSVSYSNPKHFSGFFSVLKDLQTDSKFQDVTLEVCGRLFPCHRLVLAGVSPYFRTMFSVGLQEGHVSIQEPCLDQGSIQSVIQYAYSGELQLSTDELHGIQRLAVAAKFLQVDFVCETCAALLESQMDISNAVQTFLFAASNDIENLRASSKAFICRYFPRVSLTEGFKDLSPDQFLELISCDELDVKSEMLVWEAAANWVESDESSRTSHLPEILQNIRFPLLTQDDIETINTHKLLRESPRLVAQIAAQIQPVVSEEVSERPPGGGRKRYGMAAEEMLVIFGVRNTDSSWDDLSEGRVTSAEELDGTLACFSPLTREVYSMAKPGDTCPAAVVATPSSDIYAIYTTSAPRFLRYDHLDSCWVERAAPLRWPRHPRELICSHGCLYLFSDDGDMPVQQYQPKVNQWFQVASVSLDDDTVCVSLNDRLYAVGPEQTIRYDHNVDQWERLASLRNKLDRIANAVSCAGRIFCVDYDLTKMMAYNPARDKWKTATCELPDCSYFHLVLSETRDELFGLASQQADPDQPLVNKFLYRYNQGARRCEHLLDIPNRLSVFDTYSCLAARMYPPALGGGDDFPDPEGSGQDRDGGSHDDDDDDNDDDDDQNEGPTGTEGQ